VVSFGIQLAALNPDHLIEVTCPQTKDFLSKGPEMRQVASEMLAHANHMFLGNPITPNRTCRYRLEDHPCLIADVDSARLGIFEKLPFVPRWFRKSGLNEEVQRRQLDRAHDLSRDVL
jgi:hypothetical protein